MAFVRALAGAISRGQMSWLFNRRFVGWMRDASLRRQLPPCHRLFAAYCVTWMALTDYPWIVGGKQAFFVLSWLHRLAGGSRVWGLTLPDAKVGLDLSDPRYLKVAHEVQAGSAHTAVLGALLAEGDSFVDIGANHGAYSLAAARIIGPTGAIVAVEAQPLLARLVEQTLADSVRCRYRVHAVALGERRGRVPFFLLRRNSGESGLFRGPSTAGVHAVTELAMERFDDEIAWRDLPGRVVVKIDVEGAEDRVLAGALTCLVTRRPTLLMEVNPGCMAAAGVSWEQLATRLKNAGYDRYAELDAPRACAPLDAMDPSRQRDIVVWPSDGPGVAPPPAGASVAP